MPLNDIVGWTSTSTSCVSGALGCESLAQSRERFHFQQSEEFALRTESIVGHVQGIKSNIPAPLTG